MHTEDNTDHDEKWEFERAIMFQAYAVRSRLPKSGRGYRGGRLHIDKNGYSRQGPFSARQGVSSAVSSRGLIGASVQEQQARLSAVSSHPDCSSFGRRARGEQGDSNHQDQINFVPINFSSTKKATVIVSCGGQGPNCCWRHRIEFRRPSHGWLLPSQDVNQSYSGRLGKATND